MQRQARLQDLLLGSIDAKNDLLTESGETANAFENSFVVPKDFSQERFDEGRIQFIVGTKGTGKTALLRWLGRRKTQKGHKIDFVLFKSDILEEDRMRMSRAVDYSVVSQKEGFADIFQDFKYGWMVFALKRIADAIYKDASIVSRDDAHQRDEFLQFMGYELAGKNIVASRWKGMLPPIRGGKVRLGLNLEFFRAEFEGEIKPDEKIGEVSLGDFARRALDRLAGLSFTGKRFVMCFDELEVFKLDEENYKRDIRMVRDLLFAVADLNRKFLQQQVPIQLVAAVRSEVLADVQHVGEEIGRTVRDLGIQLQWYSGPRTREHPLMQIVQRKLRQSEIALYGGAAKDADLWALYFDEQVGNKNVERFLLDASFMRPRDIIRRLTVCAKLAPASTKFTSEVLTGSVPEYSREMWSEIAEELVPRYFTQEVKAIEQLFYGYFTRFILESFKARLEERCRLDPYARQIRERIGAVELLNDLFRLGAIGNLVERDGKRRFDWYYGGRQTLDPYGTIVVHQSLWNHLALSSKRGREAEFKSARGPHGEKSVKNGPRPLQHRGGPGRSRGRGPKRPRDG
ncbi:MAG: hypothetical protein K2P70_13760 [Hyphomonadaceae bacterium]|nr:hypothetical protein [Hyphomonadaceae bacterium]